MNCSDRHSLQATLTTDDWNAIEQSEANVVLRSKHHAETSLAMGLLKHIGGKTGELRALYRRR